MSETESPSSRKTGRKKVTATRKKAAKKTVVKKTAVKKTTTKRKVTRKKSVSQARPAARVVSVEERHRMIAECAYHRGQESPEKGQDVDHRHWLAAEQEVDAMIAKWTESGH